jgi:hypothetical protein
MLNTGPNAKIDCLVYAINKQIWGVYNTIGRSEDREAIEKALEARGVCFHSLYNELHPPPPPEGWGPPWAEMFMDMEGGMLEDDVLEEEEL